MFSDPLCISHVALRGVTAILSCSGVLLQDGPDVSGEAAGGPGDAGEGAAERRKGVPETRVLPDPGHCSGQRHR